MCGGDFKCSKNALIGLNACYMLVALLLIVVASYGKSAAYVDSLPIIGGITACGVFLLIISVVGLIGAIKHHQVMLFFYMIILGLIFIIQFSVACACLAVNKDTEIKLAQLGWENADNQTKFEAEKLFDCCGFTNKTEGIRCDEIPGCSPHNGTVAKETSCMACSPSIEGSINHAFNVAGSLGLIFSFTEMVGAYLAMKYRNQMDPQAARVAAASNTLFDGNM